MAVKTNLLADPAFAQGLSGLTELFAPPKASDVYAYAKARQTADETRRLADFYTLAKDPSTSRDILDRIGVGVGRFNPTSGYYAIDKSAETSRLNNAADIASREKLAADSNALDLKKFYEGDVKAGQNETVFMSPERQKRMGAAAPSVRGNIILSQGQQATLPPGTGSPVTPGKSDDEDAPAVSSQGVVIKGAEPSNSNAQLYNYKKPDGSVGTAVYDDKQGFKDTQTGVKLPGGIQTYTANLSGDKSGTGLGQTVTNNAEGQLVDLALAENTAKQLRNLLKSNPGAQGLVGQMRGTVQDVTQAGKEVGQLLNLNMAKLQKDVLEGRVDKDVAAKFANFDPSIPAANMLETLLTAQMAKVLDRDGRISNERYNQMAKALGAGGWTSNQQRTFATLDVIDNIINSQRKLLAPAAPNAAKIPAFSGAGAPTPGPTPEGPVVERWERGPDGQLRKAQ